MAEAIPVSRAALEMVKGIIPDEVIAEWKERKEIIEVEDNGNKH